MPRVLTFITSAVVAIILLFSLMTSATQAAQPGYLVLKPAKNVSGSYRSGRGYSVSTSTYSYGWFGARPTTKWSRHTGYHGYYTQWRQR